MKLKRSFLIIIMISILIGVNSWIVRQEQKLTPNLLSINEDMQTGGPSLGKSSPQSLTQTPTRIKTTKVTAPINVACVFAASSLGINDQGFNSMAYTGLQKAELDGLCTFDYVEPTDSSQYQGFLDSYASSGNYNLIVAIGVGQGTAVNNTAMAHPGQAIALIDYTINQGNVSSIIFKEHEGSFLVGAMAGLMTQTGRVGFIGGMDIPLIRKFWVGYSAGVLYEKNTSYIEVFEDFVGAWDDPTTGKNLAEDMWAKGVDIIFAAAGGSGTGVLESANEAGEGFYAIGVDSDQDYLYPGRVLCSMMKRVDFAVYNAVKDVYDSTWSPGVKEMGLTENGVGISPLNYTKDIIGSDFIHEVNVTVRDKINSGQIVVPTNSTELTQWITTMGITSKTYTPHVPIFITTSNDFTSLGFSGTGTPGDPYRIEGLYINDTSATLIYVSGVTDHFIIGANLLNGLSSANYGIIFYGISNGTIANNTIYNCEAQGIRLENSNNNAIVNNTVHINRYNGINLDNSNNNTISNNQIHDNFEQSGIWIDQTSEHNMLSNNIVHNNNQDGIRLLSSSNYNLIVNNTCYNNNWAGIRLQSANHYNTITNNTIYGNGFNGILIEGPTPSDNNTVTDNIAFNNLGHGIALWQNSSSNLIRNNTIYKNEMDGIYIEESTNNRLIHNYVSNNGRYGILLFNSPNHYIKDNFLRNNGIYWAGPTFGSYIQTSLENNWINGKPFVYWNGINGGTVPTGAGQIFLFNCVDVTITNQNLHNTSVGISAAYSSLLTIQNSNVYNTRWGILIERHTNKTTITNNMVYNNIGDIQLWLADNNTVTGNSIGKNSNYGIVFDTAHNNLITNNTIFETKMSGIVFWGGSENMLKQNRFHNNEGHVIMLDDATDSNIIKFNDFFDNYVEGSQAVDNGTNNMFKYNYWSDWTGPDYDNDRIVDISYTIDGTANNHDPYPLVFTTTYSQCYLVALQVLYPNGGETVDGKITIQWSMPEDSHGHQITFVLFYSDGGEWTLIDSELTTTSYQWDTNNVPDGSTYRIRVVAICEGDKTIEDFSDDMFTIQNHGPIVTSTAQTTSTTMTSTSIEYTGAQPSIPAPGMTGIIAVLSLFPVLILRKVIRKTRESE